MKSRIDLSKKPEVIQTGVDAYRAAQDAALSEGKSNTEADVAGKNASLEARKAKIDELRASS